jgi:hypothetical protein
MYVPGYKVVIAQTMSSMSMPIKTLLEIKFLRNGSFLNIVRVPKPLFPTNCHLQTTPMKLPCWRLGAVNIGSD